MRMIVVATQAGVHQKGKLVLSDILRDIKQNPDFDKAGAVALFIGVVRGETGDMRVQKLKIEAYEEKADEVLSRVCRKLKKRAGIVDVQIHHLLGEFNTGEDLVYVAVAGSHRKDVFDVLEEAVGMYKKEVPIFKKEYVVNKRGQKSAYWTTEHANTPKLQEECQKLPSPSLKKCYKRTLRKVTLRRHEIGET